jgi:hypothetical protein
MTYIIKGRYLNGPKETIDEFDRKQEAEEMLQEYALAYGPDWTLWIVEHP